MTKKEFEKIINKILGNYSIDWDYWSFDEWESVYNDIEEETDLLYFDTISCDWRAIATQVFTSIPFKNSNYDVIIDFEMPLAKNKNELIETLWGEYQNAKRNQNIFNS